MHIGTQVTKYKTIRELINDSNVKDKLHYFYILRLPRCGGSRIKIGKSAAIVGRMKYYQSYFFSSEVEFLELRSFPNQMTNRYGEKAKLVYSVFEDEVKEALRNFGTEKITSGDGKITEWFPSKSRQELMKTYNDFIQKFKSMRHEKTLKKESLKRGVKKPVDYKEKNEDDI